jgi:hypothetical protein
MTTHHYLNLYRNAINSKYWGLHTLINNIISDTNIHQKQIGGKITKFTVDNQQIKADVVYNNNANNNVSIIHEEVTNTILTIEPQNKNNENNLDNTDNIVVDVLPIIEQPPIDNNTESVAVNLNLPVLHYDINDNEGMM